MVKYDVLFVVWTEFLNFTLTSFGFKELINLDFIFVLKVTIRVYISGFVRRYTLIVIIRNILIMTVDVFGLNYIKGLVNFL
jgi:hypothetical protein